MRPSSRWQLGRILFSEKGKCPLGPSLSIRYIYLEEPGSLWSCSRIAWRGDQSCDSQDICFRGGKNFKIKRSSYNRRFNQRNGEGSQSKFLKPNSWVINRYSSVWAEVPSKTPTARSRLQCDALRLSRPITQFLCSTFPASHTELFPWRGGRTEQREGNPASQPERKGLVPRCVRQMTEGRESKSEAKLAKCLCKIVSSEAQGRCVTWNIDECQGPRIRFPFGRHWGFQGCCAGFSLFSLLCKFQMPEQRCSLPGAEGEKQPSLKL